MAIALPSTPSDPALPRVDWEDLQRQMAAVARRRPVDRLWPEASPPVLLWGLATASLDAERLREIGALAALLRGDTSPGDVPDWNEAAEGFVDRLAEPDMEDAVPAAAWGYAMPELAGQLESRRWWATLERLRGTATAACGEPAARPLARLLFGAELGLALAWRLGELPGFEAAADAPRRALERWLEDDEASTADAVGEGGRWARAAVASLIRLIPLARRDGQPKLRKRQLDVPRRIAHAAECLMRPDGSAAWSTAGAGDGQLWPRAAEAFHDPSLAAAALWAAGPRKHARGKSMAAEAELPETAFYDPDAQLAAFRASWLHRRGRLALDFSNRRFRIEAGAGKCVFLRGRWTVKVEIDGRPRRPTGPWEPVCWHSDDDVHYLELEQPFGGGATLQRQVLLARDDEWLLLADAVVTDADAEIDYTGRLPTTDAVRLDAEPETREVWIAEDDRRRVQAMPLDLPEWRIERARGALEEREGRLSVTARGPGRLYAPLLLDLRPRRFRSPRTWRKLTVAEDLRIVAPGEAAGYRVQIGGDQWLLYRTLAPARRRTVLGKNLIADFFAGRFDANDGSTEELIAVEANEDDA